MIYAVLLSMLLLLSGPSGAHAADPKPTRPCTLENKTFCGKWAFFTFYGDYIEWDKKYGDIAHCTVLDERQLPDRVYSILRCTEQRHLQRRNCAQALKSRIEGAEPAKCFDPINGKGHSYTIEKPKFWMFMAHKVKPRFLFPKGLKYSFAVDEHLDCIFQPIDNEDGTKEAIMWTKFSEEVYCDTDDEFYGEINEDIPPEFLSD